MENSTAQVSGPVGPCESGRRLLSALPLVVVVVAPAAASWLGLTAVGREWLGLPGVWALLVPLTFDAAALYVAALSWRSVLAGDSALVDRLLVWTYAVGSAGLNVWHASGAAAAVFFGSASVSAVVLWDRTLRARRRDALRAIGAIEPPLPRFRLLRWVVAPGETARAWRGAIVAGVTSPAEALALARNSVSGSGSGARAEVAALKAGTTVDESLVDFEGEPAVDELVRAELAECESKSAALVVAWRHLGVEGVPETVDVLPAVDWLAAHGVRVDKSMGYETRRRMQRKATGRPVALTSVGGAS